MLTVDVRMVRSTSAASLNSLIVLGFELCKRRVGTAVLSPDIVASHLIM